MSISKFLNDKIKKDTENEEFKKWIEKDILKNLFGTPVISFHGSIDNHFEEINFEKSSDDWYVGKGFYTSDSIDDVNFNYSTKSFVWDATKNGKRAGSDLTARVSNLQEKLEYYGDKFVNEYFNVDDISDYIDNDGISLENANLLGKSDFSYLSLNEEGLIEWDDFITAVAEKHYIKNEGWVTPVYIKMENPLFYTTDENATKIYPLPNEVKDFLDIEETEIERFKDLIDTFIDKAVEKEFIEKNELTAEELFSQTECYNGTFIEADGEEVYNCLIELFNDNDCEYCEELETLLKELFIEFDYLEEDDNELIFNNIIIGDMNFENSKEYFELYQNIIESCINSPLGSDYITEIRECFSAFEENIYNNSTSLEDVTVYDLFKFIQKYEEPMCLTIFNQGIKNLFDGIVLDAYEANKDWRMEGIDYDTRHFIIFNENNAKFALYNNGDYSLENNNMAARKSQKQKKHYTSYKEEQMIEDFKNRFSKFKKLPEIFFTKSLAMEEDAILNKEENQLVINLLNVYNKEDLNKLITHELIGHYGLDLILKPKEKSKLLSEVANHYKKEGLKDIMKLYPELDYNKPEDRLRLAEEKICFYAEKHFTDDSFMNSVFNKIKSSFIKFKKALKINEIEDDMFLHLYNSKKNIESKKPVRAFNYKIKPA